MPSVSAKTPFWIFTSRTHRLNATARICGSAARHPGASVEDGLAWIRETLALLKVPGLAAFGLGPQHVGDIAAKALTSSSMQGNPVALGQDDLKAILLQAL